MNAAASRLFSAHCSNEGSHRSDFVTAADSFEEAAVLFAERWPEIGEACRIIVVDAESGEQHCFNVDLEETQATPC
ncbi:MAG TPA: DUF5961 family protein [Caulobacteraceae bacterium]